MLDLLRFCCITKLVAMCCLFDIDILLPNGPAVSTAARHAMAVLALGDAAQPPEFYEPFSATTTASTAVAVTDASSRTITDANTPDASSAVDDSVTMVTTEQSNTDKQPAPVVPNDSGSMMKAAFQQMADKHHQFGSSTSGWHRVLQRLGNIRTTTQWETFLHSFGGAVPQRHHHRATIRVQPTALSRRMPGVSRGSKRRASGRPASTDPARRKTKRPRNLNYNVLHNQPNAKSHGEGH